MRSTDRIPPSASSSASASRPTTTDGYAGSMNRHHIVGQGPDAAEDVVRATMLRLANHFAEGSAGVRPELADRVIAALNGGETPRLRTIGSIGQADLAPLADLAAALFDGLALEAGEGTALLDNNAFSTGWAALAVTDAIALLDSMDVAGALSLEGLGANPTMLHAAIGEVRPYPGLRRTLDRLRRAAQRERDLGSGNGPPPPGSAVVPEPAPDPGRLPRRPRPRGGATRDRAQCVPGQPDRRRRGGAGHLRRELRDPAPRGRPRLSPTHPRHRPDELVRADGQVARRALDRAADGADAAAGNDRSGLDLPQPGRPESCRGSPPPGPACFVRADLDRPCRGDRGPDDDGAARRATCRGNGRARGANRRHRAGRCRPGDRPAWPATGQRDRGGGGGRAAGRPVPRHGRLGR